MIIAIKKMPQSISLFIFFVLLIGVLEVIFTPLKFEDLVRVSGTVTSVDAKNNNRGAFVKLRLESGSSVILNVEGIKTQSVIDIKAIEIGSSVSAWYRGNMKSKFDSYLTSQFMSNNKMLLAYQDTFEREVMLFRILWFSVSLFGLLALVFEVFRWLRLGK